MKSIQVWIEGHTALLQHRATEESLNGNSKTRRNSAQAAEDPRNFCEKHIYRMPNKQIAVPGAAFSRLLREAGGAHKIRGSRKSLKYLIPASVLISEDLCPLFLKDCKTPITDFEVDSRPVTIPATKGRVMRYRARFNEWACCVNLRINDDLIAEELVRQILTEGLQQIGIGDFRPEKGGPFGTSTLTSWKVLNIRPLTIAQQRNSRVRLVSK